MDLDKNRSTTDFIFTLRLIIEKHLEYEYE